MVQTAVSAAPDSRRGTPHRDFAHFDSRPDRLDTLPQHIHLASFPVQGTRRQRLKAWPDHCHTAMVIPLAAWLEQQTANRMAAPAHSESPAVHQESREDNKANAMPPLASKKIHWRRPRSVLAVSTQR